MLSSKNAEASTTTTFVAGWMMLILEMIPQPCQGAFFWRHFVLFRSRHECTRLKEDERGLETS